MATYTSKKGQTVNTNLSFGEALAICERLTNSEFAQKLVNQERAYQDQRRIQGTNYPRGFWPLKGDQLFWVYKIAQDQVNREARQARPQAPAMPAAEQRTPPAPAPQAAPAAVEPTPAPTPKAKRGRKARTDKPAPVAATFVGQPPAMLAALANVRIDSERPDALGGYILLGRAMECLAADPYLRREAFLALATWLKDDGEEIRKLAD
jgi:pyruvate/2-oxoglutarate dehydrogenase complex dihydrolipoamide acyltransferase (E2) component